MTLRALVVLAAVVLAVSGFTGPVSAVSFGPISVPGTSDLWLAGMPAGSTASGTGSLSGPDEAPAQSPVLVPGLSLAGGSTITFGVTGVGVSNSGVCCDALEGSTFVKHADGVQNGIGNVNAPINSLIGVFLTSSQPDPSAVPSEFNFASSGVNFLSLAPGLQQPFFIGDGLTGPGGVVQSFIVPDGATRLFLGTMDEFEWRNNSGSFTVFGELIAADLAPTPEPATLLLFAATAAGLGWARRKRSAA